eukprot:GEMP01015342.1.p1 GENE.GEMP01015342.1~~GEMP01015342.1.p1  ORF type:complete len:305 (+),score=84.89 GEMP01015342.1:342-1256(+)
MGVSRNLTPIFVKYRNDHKAKKNRFGTGLLSRSSAAYNGGHQRLLTEDRDEIEMSSLPPQWVDVAEEAKAEIGQLKERLEQLRKAHQKRLRQVFKDDDDRGDREIESIAISVSENFRACEAKIRQIQTTGADLGITNKDYGLRTNVQRSLATTLQQFSQQFRKYQKAYLDELQKRNKNTWDDALDLTGIQGQDTTGMSDAQIMAHEANVNITQRSEEITRVAQSISDLHTIFKELAVLVIDQGTILDRIDYNVEQVVHQSREANVQLSKAREKAKSNRAMKCIMFLVVGIAVLLFLNIIKYSSY